MQQRQGASFDRIASGHYALIDRSAGEGGPVQLRSTPDAIKDQTYFLAGLSQEQLSRCTFPLGCLTKVGRLAAHLSAPCSEGMQIGPHAVADGAEERSGTAWCSGATSPNKHAEYHSHPEHSMLANALPISIRARARIGMAVAQMSVRACRLR